MFHSSTALGTPVSVPLCLNGRFTIVETIGSGNICVVVKLKKNSMIEQYQCGLKLVKREEQVYHSQGSKNATILNNSVSDIINHVEEKNATQRCSRIISQNGNMNEINEMSNSTKDDIEFDTNNKIAHNDEGNNNKDNKSENEMVKESNEKRIRNNFSDFDDSICRSTIKSNPSNFDYIKNDQETKYYAGKIVSRADLIKFNALQDFEKELRVNCILSASSSFNNNNNNCNNRNNNNNYNHDCDYLNCENSGKENILHYEDIIYLQDYIIIISEYCGFGDLNKYFATFPLSLMLKISILYKVLKGVEFLHDHSIAHRDIKLENIYLTHNFTPKIGDFGCCEFLHNRKNQTANFYGNLLNLTPLHKNNSSNYNNCSYGYCNNNYCNNYQTAAIFGTKQYQPPEIVKLSLMHNKNNDDEKNIEMNGDVLNNIDFKKVDIYQFGILCYVMFIEQFPWDENEDIDEQIIRNDINFTSPLIPTFIVDLIRSSTHSDPDKRMSAKQLLKMPIFKNVVNECGNSSNIGKSLRKISKTKAKSFSTSTATNTSANSNKRTKAFNHCRFLESASSLAQITHDFGKTRQKFRFLREEKHNL